MKGQCCPSDGLPGCHCVTFVVLNHVAGPYCRVASAGRHVAAAGRCAGAVGCHSGPNCSSVPPTLLAYIIIPMVYPVRIQT